MKLEGLVLLISHVALIISCNLEFESHKSSCVITHPYLIDISERLCPPVARGTDRRESNASRVGDSFSLRRFELLVLTDVNEPQQQGKQSNYHTNCGIGGAAGRIVGIVALCAKRKRMDRS